MQSAPLRKPSIRVGVSESAPRITARWEIDLSPGTSQLPPTAGAGRIFLDSIEQRLAEALRFFQMGGESGCGKGSIEALKFFLKTADRVTQRAGVGAQDLRPLVRIGR